MGIFDFNQSNFISMKKLYALIVLVVVFAVASCSGFYEEKENQQDMERYWEELNSQSKEELKDATYDPTNPDDSTENPFPDEI